MRKVRNVKRVAPRQMMEHTPIKLLANSMSWGLKYMLAQGGAQSGAPRNDDPWSGLVFNCRGHQKPRSLMTDEEDDMVVVTERPGPSGKLHGCNLENKRYEYAYERI